jgi:hypothetical protein
MLDSEEATREVISLMWDDKDGVRLAAVEVALERVPGDKHEALLDFYVSQGPYFYNVVRAMDRQLYARAWLREALS